jgi:hypothetical protein
MIPYLINFSRNDSQEEWRISQVYLFLMKNYPSLIRNYSLLQIISLLLLLILSSVLKCFVMLILVEFSLLCFVFTWYPPAIRQSLNANSCGFQDNFRNCGCSYSPIIGWTWMISLFTMPHFNFYDFLLLCFQFSIPILYIYHFFSPIRSSASFFEEKNSWLFYPDPPHLKLKIGIDVCETPRLLIQ